MGAGHTEVASVWAEAGRDPSERIVHVAGEVDLATGGLVREPLLEAAEEPGLRRLVVDLSEVTFMGSTGLGILVGALRRMKERGGELTVRGLSPQLRRVFEITGLLSPFGVEE